MKKTLKLLAFIFTFIVICTFVIYLFFSFAMWDFNPGHWANPARGICSFVSAVMGVMIGSILGSTNNQNK